MKKKNIKMISLLTGFLLLGSIYYLFFLDTNDYYTQIKDTKIKIEKNRTQKKYIYKVIAYNKNGRKKEISFRSSEKYLDGTYLKINKKKRKKISYEELPSLVIHKMNIEKITLEEIEKIKEIILTFNNQSKSIINKKSIKEVQNTLRKSYLTNDKSIQDIPIHTDEWIKIDFLFEEGMTTLFIYKKKNNYYIEKPYSAIYSIGKREYEKIKYYMKRVE